MLLILSEKTVTPKKRSRIIRPGDVPTSITPYTLLVRLFKKPFLRTPREVHPMYPGLSAILQQGAALPYDMLPTQSIGNWQGNVAPVRKTIHRVIRNADTLLIRTNSTRSSGQVGNKTERNTAWRKKNTFKGTTLKGQRFARKRWIRHSGQ